MNFKDEIGEPWSEAQLQNHLKMLEKKRKQQQSPMPTITSGFGAEVLRLTARDIQFLEGCGIKVE